MPYTSATQSGVTQLAMYYKKPMLVTNIGGLPEVIDHNKDGYISSPNAEEMSEYILDYNFSSEVSDLGDAMDQLQSGVGLNLQSKLYRKLHKKP